MERSLNVWINNTCVGRLRESNGLWAFAYTQAWLGDPNGHPLCPLLPLQAEEIHDGATVRPVQWFFDNLLPEEGQRILIARAADTTVEDAFALLAHFGAESAGSLTLLPPEQEPAPGKIQTLSWSELSRRIDEMPNIPLAAQTAKKMSLAGAQHKMAVIYRDGQLYEPMGSEPSTHILKPNHPDDNWPHSVINEWYVMKLAKQVGLSVPEVYREYLPQPVYLIERFDRKKTDQTWLRLHCIDACQLTGLAKEFKYSAGNIQRLSDLATHCRPAALARMQLFRWLVFNVLIGNEDAHLKNLSFLLSGQSVGLAPFYDLLCTAVYGTKALDGNAWPHQATMAWSILGVEHLAHITAALLIEAGQAMGIKPATARDTIRKMIDSVRAEAPKLLEDVLEENQKIVQTKPKVAVFLAGETRLLRTINSIIIREMSAQLSKGL